MKIHTHLKWILALTAGLAGIVFSLPIFLLSLITVVITILTWYFLPQFLIALPAILPFQPALNPSASLDLASGRVLILLLAAVGIVKIIMSGKKWFHLSSSTLLIIFFLFWTMLSGLAAENTDWYIRKVLVFLSIFPIYFLTLAFLKKEHWKKLFSVWNYTAFLISLLAVFQFLLQFIVGKAWFLKLWGKVIGPVLYGQNLGEAVISNPSWLVGTGVGDLLRAIATFPDPHMLAFYLGMSIPIQAVLAVRKKYFWIFPAVSLLALTLTFSRGGYVGLAGVFILLFIYLWKYFPKQKHRLVGGLLAVILIFSVAAPLRERFVSIVDIGEGSNKGRLEIWADSKDIILDNPILGVGLGNYAAIVRPESKYREPIYAHNTYLDIASEAGLPALLAWILLLFWGILPVFKLLLSNAKSSSEQWNAAAAFSILWFSLHSFFETPIFSPRILPLILLLLAFRAFMELKSRGKSRLYPKLRE